MAASFLRGVSAATEATSHHSHDSSVMCPHNNNSFECCSLKPGQKVFWCSDAMCNETGIVVRCVGTVRSDPDTHSYTVKKQDGTTVEVPGYLIRMNADYHAYHTRRTRSSLSQCCNHSNKIPIERKRRRHASGHPEQRSDANTVKSLGNDALGMPSGMNLHATRKLSAAGNVGATNGTQSSDSAATSNRNQGMGPLGIRIPPRTRLSAGTGMHQTNGTGAAAEDGGQEVDDNADEGIDLSDGAMFDFDDEQQLLFSPPSQNTRLQAREHGGLYFYLSGANQGATAATAVNSTGFFPLPIERQRSYTAAPDVSTVDFDPAVLSSSNGGSELCNGDGGEEDMEICFGSNFTNVNDVNSVENENDEVEEMDVMAQSLANLCHGEANSDANSPTHANFKHSRIERKDSGSAKNGRNRNKNNSSNSGGDFSQFHCNGDVECNGFKSPPPPPAVRKTRRSGAFSGGGSGPSSGGGGVPRYSQSSNEQ